MESISLKETLLTVGITWWGKYLTTEPEKIDKIADYYEGVRKHYKE